MKYKVGDRVVIAKEWHSGYQNCEGKMDKWQGKTMTVRGYDTNAGEDCYRMKEDAKEHHGGWYWHEADIVGLEENHKIVITADGKTTTARLFDGKELIRKAEAKCSPDDTFDFMVGAKLAMERLEEPKPVNPFKAGDYVKITGNKSYNHGLPVGSVGRVIKTDNESCYVDGFSNRGSHMEQFVDIAELEKI